MKYFLLFSTFYYLFLSKISVDQNNNYQIEKIERDEKKNFTAKDNTFCMVSENTLSGIYNYDIKIPVDSDLSENFTISYCKSDTSDSPTEFKEYHSEWVRSLDSYIISISVPIENDKKYTFVKKFINYFTLHSFKILINFFENIFLLIKIKTILLNYAKIEIDKIKNDFIITIDSNTYDLTISKNKIKNNHLNENNHNNQLFQYIICFSSLGDEVLDQKLLTEKEIGIYKDAKENIEKNQKKEIKLKMNYIYSIIIGIYIVSFYFLTFGQIKEYIIFNTIALIGQFAMDKFYFNRKFNDFNRESDYDSNKMNIKNGYIVYTNNYVIEIFKLNKIHEEEGNNFNKIYLKYLDEIETMHEEIVNIINCCELIKLYF